MKNCSQKKKEKERKEKRNVVLGLFSIEGE